MIGSSQQKYNAVDNAEAWAVVPAECGFELENREVFLPHFIGNVMLVISEN